MEHGPASHAGLAEIIDDIGFDMLRSSTFLRSFAI